MSELDLLKSENLKLRTYISLISAETQLTQRIFEIRQNFANSTESESVVVPILNRLSKIKSEKQVLQNELNLVK
jgi:hypothetical protein